MNCALIAASPNENTAPIEQLLRSEGFTRITYALSGNEARRLMMIDPEPELVMIFAPLADEFGQELAVSAVEYTSAAVILLCGSDIAGEIFGQTEEYGITVLSRACDRQELAEAIKASSGSSSEKENAAILTKIDEMRLINRAKCRLMQYLNFTEPQAHKYIEKQAMNNRQTRKEAAEKILAAYEK